MNLAKKLLRIMLRFSRLEATLSAKNVLLDNDDTTYGSEPGRGYELVGSMAICNICKNRRAKTGLGPNETEALPLGTTQHPLFRRKSTPVMLCPECDGGAYDAAMKLHNDDQVPTG